MAAEELVFGEVKGSRERLSKIDADIEKARQELMDCINRYNELEENWPASMVV